jgi:hypothetical protein
MSRVLTKIDPAAVRSDTALIATGRVKLNRQVARRSFTTSRALLANPYCMLAGRFYEWHEHKHHVQISFGIFSRQPAAWHMRCSIGRRAYFWI